MKEDFLHYVWQLQYFHNLPLYTQNKQRIHIIHPGHPHQNAGPDFKNAHLRIADIHWHGHVEIHVNASDWLLHQHQKDPNYNSVILHVVWHQDSLRIPRQNNTILPTLVLQPYLPPSLLQQYKKLLRTPQRIPCQYGLHQIPLARRQLFLHRLAAERLIQKTSEIHTLWLRHRKNWNQTFFVLLARYIVGPVNAAPAQWLAERAHIQHLTTLQTQPQKIHSYLLGMAGFLSTQTTHPYLKTLHTDFIALQRTFNIDPLSVRVWRYARMRPSNFPERRLAQLAQFFTQTQINFDTFRQIESPKTFLEAWQRPLPDFWKTHFRLGKTSDAARTSMGKQLPQRLLINALIPLLFAYGKIQNLPEYCEKALAWLAEQPKENHATTRHWKRIGWPARHALDTQALLQLKNKYCTPKRCLKCTLGHYLLKCASNPTLPSKF